MARVEQQLVTADMLLITLGVLGIIGTTFSVVRVWRPGSHAAYVRRFQQNIGAVSRLDAAAFARCAVSGHLIMGSGFLIVVAAGVTDDYPTVGVAALSCFALAVILWTTGRFSRQAAHPHPAAISRHE